jgi:hypothetical protein
MRVIGLGWNKLRHRLLEDRPARRLTNLSQIVLLAPWGVAVLVSKVPAASVVQERDLVSGRVAHCQVGPRLRSFHLPPKLIDFFFHRYLCDEDLVP